jgi:hypothetical protein
LSGGIKGAFLLVDERKKSTPVITATAMINDQVFFM